MTPEDWDACTCNLCHIYKPGRFGDANLTAMPLPRFLHALGLYRERADHERLMHTWAERRGLDPRRAVRVSLLWQVRVTTRRLAAQAEAARCHDEDLTRRLRQARCDSAMTQFVYKFYERGALDTARAAKPSPDTEIPSGRLLYDPLTEAQLEANRLSRENDPEWRRWCIAYHEACHVIAAQELGLPVAWVDIESGYAEGINFTAAVCIPDEVIDLERDARAIAIAMACPSFLTSRHREIDRHAKLEAEAAYEMAESFGIPKGDIWDQAGWIAEWREDEIQEFASRLDHEGRIEFDAPASP
jgi:hypothetical protein